MIDTIKIYCNISNKIKQIIESTSNIKSSYDKGTGQIYYEIVLNSVECSYSSKINLRCNRYNINGAILDIECSLHKILHYQNAYNGFCDLKQIVTIIKDILEQEYNIILPSVENFYLQRIDIARCFDLLSQDDINEYLYNISFLRYPKRRLKFYENECLYVNGSSTTLKIYNKLAEFKKHDRLKMMQNIGGDFVSFFENKIKGYIRYEVEIKKRFLNTLCSKEDISILDLSYNDFLNVWDIEFKKLYSISKDATISDKIKIKNRLINFYGKLKGNNLYSFYLRLITDGQKNVRNSISKSSYNRKTKELRDLQIDFSQRYKIQKQKEKGLIDFNPFINIEREVF